MAEFFVLGGGDFRSAPREIDTLIAEAARAKAPDRKPNVLLLPQASAESKPFVNSFYKVYGKLKCKATCVLFAKGEMDFLHIAEKFKAADVIYIGGGHFGRLKDALFGMGLDRLLQEAAAEGKIIAGSSAGANVLFEHAVSDMQIASGLSDRMCIVEGFGLLPGVFSPHAEEVGRLPLLHEFAEKNNYPFIACASNEAVHIKDGSARQVFGTAGLISDGYLNIRQ